MIIPLNMLMVNKVSNNDILKLPMLDLLMNLR
jgi:hypothetical protein